MMAVIKVLRALAPACIPLAYFGISVLAFCALVSTPLSKKFLRLLLQLAVIGFTWLSFSTAHFLGAPLDGLWGLGMTLFVSHTSSLLLFEKTLLLVKSKDDTCRQQSVFCACRQHRLLWRLWNNSRLIGTPRQVPGVPLAKPSRNLTTFALSRIGKIAVHGLAYMYLLPRIFPGPFTPMQISEFGSAHETYLRRLLLQQPQLLSPVTVRESLVRAIWAVLWAWAAYAIIDAAHDMLALFFVVVLRVDAPASWPPLYGSLADAYSIRGFWGRFWHRVTMRPYLNYAELVSRRLLRLAPGSAADRVVLFFMVFFLSGVAHAVVAWQLGDNCGWVRDIAWFCGNFVIGAAEAFVVRLLRGFAVRCGYAKHWRWISESVFAKAFGFAWVFAFFFWSVPKWQYPKLYCAIQHEIDRLELEGDLL